ncbi:hypothetical protein FZD47_25295 [Bacillus infantis]|uniref:Uncharacterized protein n=1 Tax=Bacillus infantis TaxID=324767 RepID=A0A5D4S1P0_9BACI|nr:hypothetical protein [Bacillus infantis]TYS55746.1 hypothetical protein FZD47_25295 [Bacillus infantis]
METILTFLKSPWFGVVALVLGLLATYITYRLSIKEAKFIVKSKTYTLIGDYDQEVPEEIEVYANGFAVKRLNKTVIAIWNYGNKTQEGEKNYDKDPLRLVLGDEGDLIAPPRIAVKLKKGDLKLNASPDFPRQILLDFDFIQPNDGMLIELLYSGKPREIKITGTIIDMKAEIVSGGELYKQNKVKYLPANRILRSSPFLILIAFLIFLGNNEIPLAALTGGILAGIIGNYGIDAYKARLLEKPVPEHINRHL